MLPKFYNNNTLSTHRPTQKVATCQVLSAKTKSIWQTSLSKEKILQICTDSQRSKTWDGFPDETSRSCSKTSLNNQNDKITHMFSLQTSLKLQIFQNFKFFKC